MSHDAQDDSPPATGHISPSVLSQPTIWDVVLWIAGTAFFFAVVGMSAGWWPAESLKDQSTVLDHRFSVLRVILWVFGLALIAFTIVRWVRRTQKPSSIGPVGLRGAGSPWLERAIAWQLAFPFLPLEIAFFCGISWLGFGASFGLPDLLWESHWLWRFFAGFSISLLFANALTIRFLLDHRPNRMHPPSLYPGCVVRWSEACFPRSWDPKVRELCGFLLRNWTLSLLLLISPKFLHPVNLWRLDEGYFFLVGLLGGVGAMYVMVSWFQTGQMVPPGAASFLQSTQKDRVAHWAVALLTRLASLADGVSKNLSRDLPEEIKPLHKLAGRMIAIPSYVIAGFVLAYLMASVVWSPIWVVCLMLAIFNSLHGIMIYHFSGLQYLIVTLVFLVAVVCNTSHPDKMKFPGLEGIAAVDADKPISKDDPRYRNLHLIDSEKLIRHFHEERWAKELGQGAAPLQDRKPKLVIVANSGGGIRAAVWTALVLERLEEAMPGEKGKKAAFRDHIRLMTGASGGMLGAGLYAADFENLHKQKKLSEQLARDSLWPTIQTMLFHDLPSVLTPWENRWDRGQSVEQSWKLSTAPGLSWWGRMVLCAQGAPVWTFLGVGSAEGESQSPLARSFAELQEAEAACRRPTLVFSPMLVEDCRRLLITNLDLRGATPTSFSGLSEALPGFDAAAQSVPVVEFWRLFPEAHAKFQLSTAIRMSATFPFVGPAVSLPTSPPRRVVDAGYFDNFGINLAAVWLYNHRDFIKAHTSGVLIVEVRAYPRRTEKLYFTPPPDPKSQDPVPTTELFSWGVSELSTPLEAITNLYSRGAYFRNDLLLQSLDKYFNGAARNADPTKDFFTTVAFECKGSAALSWHLPRYEFDSIKQSLAGQGHEVEQVSKWFGVGGTR